MENQNIRCKATIPALMIALTLGCFSLAPAAQAAGGHSIVGLWNVHYYVGGTEIFQSYDQWHSDGLEFEAATAYFGAVCQGTFEQAGRTVHLLHVIWTFDGNGAFSGHIEETQSNTVSHDGNSYAGTFDQKFYDVNGNFLSEATGTLSATRLSVH